MKRGGQEESSEWDHGAREEEDVTKRKSRCCVGHRKRSAGGTERRGRATD